MEGKCLKRKVVTAMAIRNAGARQRFANITPGLPLLACLDAGIDRGSAPLPIRQSSPRALAEMARQGCCLNQLHTRFYASRYYVMVMPPRHQS
ncbi:hypothetical protein [Bradyrhizobium valentinum]|uniref:hypothetical protein n=1 Tax=Bradyrhizobium valentinum TaxID=1518501 RepID=UPI000A770C53|nr:hypothetical protein [Bradyrhizobium valentinum]